jgi:hypothetical protein
MTLVFKVHRCACVCDNDTTDIIPGGIVGLSWSSRLSPRAVSFKLAGYRPHLHESAQIPTHPHTLLAINVWRVSAIMRELCP